MVGADIDGELFKVLERVARLRRAKREQYIHIERFNSIPNYKKKIKRLVSWGLLSYYKNNKCVYETHDGWLLIIGQEGMQKREHIHTITKIDQNNDNKG